MRKKKDTPESIAFWRNVEEAAFEAEETRRLNLSYTRFSCYIKGFQDGWLQRDSDDQ